MSNTVAVPQIGSPAPDFTCEALVGEEFKTVSLKDYKDLHGKLWDFTFVCPTEILAFAKAAPEFEKLNCVVIGASVDSKFTHLAWNKTPLKEGGLGGVKIPLLADLDKQVATKYGALFKETGHTLRASYLIDPNGILRQVTMNEPPVGRSVTETLRLLQAFQFADEHGEVCPANWEPGKPTLVPDPVKSKDYFSKNN